MNSQRAELLTTRLERGAAALAAFARTLSHVEWNMHHPKDGRKLGVIVHHVASVYPVEIQLAQGLAAGQPMVGIDWDTVHQMNAGHSRENDGVTKEAAIELLRRNSAAAAAAIRARSDQQLDTTATASMVAV